MPYILESNRAFYWKDIEGVGILLPHTPNDVGSLNFVISTLLNAYLEQGTVKNYEKINGAIGVLECAKQELYRVVAAPYEDGKIISHGGVYADQCK